MSSATELRLNVAAASVAGFVQPLIFNPLDCLRIRWQVASNMGHRTPFTFARDIVAKEGVLRGLCLPGQPYNSFAVALSQGLRLGLYPSVRDRLLSMRSTDGKAAVMQPETLLAGFLSGSLAYFLSAPLWLLKTRAQAAAQLGALAVAPPPTRLSSYWVGCGPLVLRGALINAGWTSGYDAMKRLLPRSGLSVVREDGPLLHICAGSAAGVGAATLSAPADVLQTAMQSHRSRVDDGLGATRARAARHGNPPPLVVTCLREIYASGGLGGFYRGWGIGVARLMPTAVVGSLIYEECRRLMSIGYTS